jgi:hypothetical protein
MRTMNGFAPIGFRKNGQPIWPIMGGAPGDGAPGDGAGQAPGSTPPQEGNQAGGQEPPAGSGQAPAADPPATGETAEARATRLERELKDTRAEAAAHRRRAQELERTQQEAAQAGMTELEREQAARKVAEDRAATLEASLRGQALESAAVSAATRLGFRNPELAVRLLDPAAIEYTEEGKPKNTEALLKAVAQAEPYLIKGGAGGDYGGGHRGDTPPAKPGMNDLIRTVLRGG